MAMATFRFLSGLFTDPFLSGIIGSVFARKMHSTSEFAKIVLSKCVCVCPRFCWLDHMHFIFVRPCFTPKTLTCWTLNEISRGAAEVCEANKNPGLSCSEVDVEASLD